MPNNSLVNSVDEDLKTSSKKEDEVQEDSIYIDPEEYLDEEERLVILERRRKERDDQELEAYNEDLRQKIANIKDLERQVRELEQIDKDERDEELNQKVFKVSIDMVPEDYYKIAVGLVGIGLTIFLMYVTLNIVDVGMGNAESGGDGGDEGGDADGEEGGDEEAGGAEGRRLADVMFQNDTI